VDEQFELLYNVLKALQKTGVLKHIVLVGSWCQYFYRKIYENSYQIPAARTTDADFLIPRRLNLDPHVNVHEILLGFGFVLAPELVEGKVAKYIHRDISFEFLADAGAQSDEKEIQIPSLNIAAQELHFLRILFDYQMTIKYQDLLLNIPELEAFALHKLIVSQRRTNEDKKRKDIETVTGIFQYFKGRDKHIRRLYEIMEEFPQGWQNKIKAALMITGLSLPE
jgi:hypothetical protein